MALTSGFFNSINGDRTYDALQMSQIFDGLIKDGIIKNWLDGFKVSFQIPSAHAVVIGTGRAWFDHVWVNNDTPLQVNLSQPNATYSRYDVIALKIDLTGRKAEIAVFEGVPSATPAVPTVTSTATLKYYPLANVLRRKSAYVVGSDVTDQRGVAPTNWAAALLEDTYSVLGRVQALEDALKPSDWERLTLASGFTGSAWARKIGPRTAEIAASINGTIPEGNTYPIITTIPAAYLAASPSGTGAPRLAAYFAGGYEGLAWIDTGGLGVTQRTGSSRTGFQIRGIYGL